MEKQKIRCPECNHDRFIRKSKELVEIYKKDDNITDELDETYICENCLFCIDDWDEVEKPIGDNPKEAKLTDVTPETMAKAKKNLSKAVSGGLNTLYPKGFKIRKQDRNRNAINGMKPTEKGYNYDTNGGYRLKQRWL